MSDLPKAETHTGALHDSSAMRVGTWNLQGRWDERHARLIERMSCDVLLLTEVNERVELQGLTLHATQHRMAPRRWWAAIAAPTLQALPDPHAASASARVGGLTFCSSILPWRSCGNRDTWVGTTTADKTIAALSEIEPTRPDIWGGDWNHALSGDEWTGSTAGRLAILEVVERLDLTVPTAKLPHRIDSLLSIDHIAVPVRRTIESAERYVAAVEGQRISDHDAYVVQISAPASEARR